MSHTRVDRWHFRAGKRRRNNWHGLDYLLFLQWQWRPAKGQLRGNTSWPINTGQMIDFVLQTGDFILEAESLWESQSWTSLDGQISEYKIVRTVTDGSTAGDQPEQALLKLNLWETPEETEARHKSPQPGNSAPNCGSQKVRTELLTCPSDSGHQPTRTPQAQRAQPAAPCPAPRAPHSWAPTAQDTGLASGETPHTRSTHLCQKLIQTEILPSPECPWICFAMMLILP